MLLFSLTSSSKNSLKVYIVFLTYIFNKLKINYSIFNLQKKKRKITLLKSPHVYKKSKEQFEISHFKTIISIKSNMDSQIIKYLILNKPKSLNIKLKFMER